MSVKDFSSSTMDESVPSWLVNGKPLWLCGLDEDASDVASDKSSIGYIVEPFPEHNPWAQIRAIWVHNILATLYVCIEKVHATRHCDKEGYDIVSVNMIKAFREEIESSYSSCSYDKDIILPAQTTLGLDKVLSNSYQILFWEYSMLPTQRWDLLIWNKK